MRPIQVGFAVQDREGVLHQRKGERRVGYPRSIAQLADEQMVAHQQRFLQRRAGDLVVLEDEQIDEIDRYQGEQDVIDPFQYRTQERILDLFPGSPVNLLCQKQIDPYDNTDQQPPILHPEAEQDIEQCG